MLVTYAGEEQRMRKILATLVALSLLIFLFTGVLTRVPEAKAAGPAPIVLGAAGNFEILAKSGISNTGTSHVTGDIGVSPAAASTITGLALVADATNVFSTSSEVTGKVYAATYAPPTPANMSTACLLYTSPSPRDRTRSRMPSSA